MSFGRDYLVDMVNQLVNKSSTSGLFPFQLHGCYCVMATGSDGPVFGKVMYGVPVPETTGHVNKTPGLPFSLQDVADALHCLTPLPEKVRLATVPCAGSYKLADVLQNAPVIDEQTYFATMRAREAEIIERACSLPQGVCATAVGELPVQYTRLGLLQAVVVTQNSIITVPRETSMWYGLHSWDVRTQFRNQELFCRDGVTKYCVYRVFITMNGLSVRENDPETVKWYGAPFVDEGTVLGRELVDKMPSLGTYCAVMKRTMDVLHDHLFSAPKPVKRKKCKETIPLLEGS